MYEDSELKANTELVMLRKLGVTTCFISDAEHILFEPSVKVVERVALLCGIRRIKNEMDAGGPSMDVTDKLVINGSGSSKGGRFHTVEINGSGTVSGDVECTSLLFNS